MGYYARFSLTVCNLNGEPSPIATSQFEAIRHNAMRGLCLHPTDTDIYLPAFLERIKADLATVSMVAPEIWDYIDSCHLDQRWYSYHEDMCALSAAFPQFVFRLDGDSLEIPDHWRRWYHAGKSQGGRAQVIIPEFTASGWQ